VPDFATPLYVVACDLTSSLDAITDPIVTSNGSDGELGLTFDEELVPALPALWYALHLPKTPWDTVDLPLRAIRDYVGEHRAHHIALIPASGLRSHRLMQALIAGHEPAIILCPSSEMHLARAATDSYGFIRPPRNFEWLDPTGLQDDWDALTNHWAETGLPLSAIARDSIAPVLGPFNTANENGASVARIRKLLAKPHLAVEDGTGIGANATQQLYCLAWLDALSQLEDEGIGPDEAEAHISRALRESARNMRVPLAISLPGISTRYSRLARNRGAKVSAVNQTRNENNPVGKGADISSERIALSLLVAHRSVANESPGLSWQEPVPDAAFHALANLERHWADGPSPVKEEQLRRRLDATMSQIWTPTFLSLLASTSQIDAFTNFPIGLLRPPGTSAPLAARVPIAYHPIMPMTRALQIEFAPTQYVDLSHGFRVLIAECIPPDDQVGSMSRAAWKLAAENLPDGKNLISVVREDTLSPDALRQAIKKHRPEVLIISAHGIHAPSQNLAGLVIGETMSMGTDLGPMPPLVVLSACHSGPRGGTVVAITDLLLRAGATSIVSTLVPVDVRHNSLFMTRFLLYLSESVAGRTGHDNVLSAWHRVQTSNVIMDIVQGNDRLMNWATTKVDGVSPLESFMTGRSRGRMSPATLYQDAEKVLLELADEQGMLSRVTAWLRTPGYLPESMMYTLVGDPAALRLQNPVVD